MHSQSEEESDSNGRSAGQQPEASSDERRHLRRRRRRLDRVPLPPEHTEGPPMHGVEAPSSNDSDDPAEGSRPGVFELMDSLREPCNVCCHDSGQTQARANAENVDVPSGCSQTAPPVPMAAMAWPNTSTCAGHPKNPADRLIGDTKAIPGLPNAEPTPAALHKWHRGEGDDGNENLGAPTCSQSGKSTTTAASYELNKSSPSNEGLRGKSEGRDSRLLIGGESWRRRRSRLPPRSREERNSFLQQADDILDLICTHLTLTYIFFCLFYIVLIVVVRIGIRCVCDWLAALLSEPTAGSPEGDDADHEDRSPKKTFRTVTTPNDCTQETLIS